MARLMSLLRKKNKREEREGKNELAGEPNEFQCWLIAGWRCSTIAQIVL
jgi:hypothetical protein